MSLDAQKDWSDLQEAAVKGISDVFPITGSRHVLDVSDVSVLDNLDSHDYKGQLEKKLGGKTWSVPIKGKVRLLDKTTGKVIDEKTVTLASLPKLTPRYSYIVGGNEYQIDHLWTRKPGVYSRVTEAGDLASEFNLAKGRNFKIFFDPKKRDFHMELAKSKIPLYPVLKALGMPDKSLEKAWGRDVLIGSQQHSELPALRKLNRALGGGPEGKVEIANKLINSFNGTKLDPSTTLMTLGKSYDKVDPMVILRASQKLLNISRGREEPDDRDSLVFKSLEAVDDKLYDRLAGKNKNRIGAKLRNRVDKYEGVGDVIGAGFFNPFVDAQFMGSGKDGSTLSNIPSQTNPIDWLNNATKTTVLAPDEGGIASENQIINSIKAVNPSHQNFVDPICTPEGSRSGITLYLPAAAMKKGRNIFTRVFDKDSKKFDYIDPTTFFKNAVVFPDQVTRKGDVFTPKSKLVKASLPGNKIGYVDWKDAKYLNHNPAATFGLATNLVPFLNVNSGNRISMVSRHLAQAIPLVEREAPLVQANTGAPGDDLSWEEVIGRGMASLKSKWSGKITDVGKDFIEIETKKGRIKQQIYNNFPLNEDGAFIHHIPAVKVGDTIKKGDLLADNNFSKNGILALGTTLKAAYASVPGKTYEDSIVVSRSAANKLRSERLYRHTIDHTPDVVLNRNKYSAYYPTAFRAGQLKKLDAEGVVKKGQILQPDDPMTASMTEIAPLSETRLIQRLGRSAVKPYRDSSVKWDGRVPGEVVDVQRVGKKTTVLVKAIEPVTEGDKLVGRYGNKGVVGSVMEDSEMPRNAKGEPVDIIMSPLGVPGRMNIGQVYETLAGKVAAKTGKPIKISPFASDNYHTLVSDLLKKHNIKDTEKLYDGSGKELGDVLTGNSYILKLKHIAEDKYSDRSGGPGSPYDVNRGPAGKSGSRAQALASLGQYALLASGSRAILNDVHSRSSDGDSADEVWRSIQLGQPLPPPRVPFAYRKFENYLRGMGVDLKKEGNNLSLLPMTDKDVKELSAGEVKSAETVRAKDLKEVAGGLFDSKATGGRDGLAFSHYQLTEPMPNPLFEDGIRALTGLSKEELRQVIRGERGLPLPLLKKATIVVGPDEGVSGSLGLKKYLDSINVEQEIAELSEHMPKLIGDSLNKANKRLRILLALKQTRMKPSDAYMMQSVPVVPPVMRPVIVKSDGNLSIDNMNELYRGMIVTDKTYRDVKDKLPESQLGGLRGELYDGLSALVGTTSKQRVQGDKLKGVLDILSGDQPKLGFVQSQLVKRRQDMSARSVITPDPSLGMDEIRIPKKMAMSIFKPFVVREMGAIGYSPLKAQEAIKVNDSMALSALDKVVRERPVLMKRDPVLHKYGIMAFKPKIHEGQDIALSPIVLGPMGGDIDGDTMAVFSPISSKAVQEAWQMLPSRNIFSAATGKVVFKPEHESVAGLFKMTYPGKETNRKYKSYDSAKKAFDNKEIGVNETVTIGGKKTSVGRHMVFNSLPKDVRDEKIITDPNFILDKKGIGSFLEGVGRKHPEKYSDVSKTLLNLGNQILYDTGSSFSLKDFEPDIATREKYLAPIRKKLKFLDPGKIVDALAAAADGMSAEHKRKEARNPNNLLLMSTGSHKPSWSQYQQLKLSPVMFQDTLGRAIPNPVAKSYAEGLDFGDYWSQSIGARNAIIGKVQEVQAPGALTKRMVNTLMGSVVTEADCGTTEGEKLGIGHPDIVDRYLAKPVSFGDKTIKAGTLITPDMVSVLKKAKVPSVEVRSPIHCKATDGLCSKALGITGNNSSPEVGENVGIIAAQSIGERATQLSLKKTHEGGAYGHSSKLINEFDRVSQLMKMPEKIPNASVLSTLSGKVTKIIKDPVGGYGVEVNGTSHYVPGKLGLIPGIRLGAPVHRGDPISTGDMNPHDLLRISGIDTVRRRMTDELDEIYSTQGIRRRNIEVLVKGLTSLALVTNPGDAIELLKGDVIPVNKIRKLNKDLNHKIIYQPVLKGVDRIPHDLSEDWISRLNHVRIKDTVIQAANSGLISRLHSLSPIPAMLRAEILDEGAEY